MTDYNYKEANKQAVAKYHKQIKDMKIRFPREDLSLGIPDYTKIISNQANKLGFKTSSDYIVSLIQNDIRTNPNGINEPDFEIIRDLRSIKSNKVD